jgi:glycosyltransferase involved in cell wall biosynthesis
MTVILVILKAFKSLIPFYHDLPGWTSVILAFFFLIGIQITFMGILGEYIARIFDEVRNRPYYIVEKVMKPPGQNEKRATNHDEEIS